jgi:hypothetical protein
VRRSVLAERVATGSADVGRAARAAGRPLVAGELLNRFDERWVLGAGAGEAGVVLTGMAVPYAVRWAAGRRIQAESDVRSFSAERCRRPPPGAGAVLG